MNELIIESDIKNNKNEKFIHFHKIIIFGDSEVGKSHFISYIKNYKDEDFKYEKELKRQDTMDSYEPSEDLIQNIERIVVDYNEDRNLYFNIYETNIHSYNLIKTNLDVLLVQIECIIIMWDNSNPESFENIPNLVLTIETGFKENKYRKVPIFIIQNKMDLNLENEEENGEGNQIKESIEKFKNENESVVYEEISLLENKKKFYQLFYRIYQKMEIFEKDFSKEIYNIDESLNNVKFENPLKPYNEENIENKKVINCIVLGNTLSGKTTFINYLIKIKDGNIIASNETFQFIFKVKIDNKIFFLNISESKGNKDYSINPSFLSKNLDGILLFFDVTKNESLNEIDNWIKSCEDKLGKLNQNYELILIGNKIDLISDRKVSKSESKNFAEKKDIKYFECSCLQGINVYEILYEISIKAYEKFFEKKKNDTTSVKLKKKQKKHNKRKCC